MKRLESLRSLKPFNWPKKQHTSAQRLRTQLEHGAPRKGRHRPDDQSPPPRSAGHSAPWPLLGGRGDARRSPLGAPTTV